MKRVKFAVYWNTSNVRICSLIHCVFINLVFGRREREPYAPATESIQMCIRANLILASIQQPIAKWFSYHRIARVVSLLSFI